MTFDKKSVSLQEGLYEGFYRLQCYNPETGVKATVTPEIAGVELIVLDQKAP
jgi:hypothetical protein